MTERRLAWKVNEVDEHGATPHALFVLQDENRQKMAVSKEKASLPTRRMRMETARWKGEGLRMRMRMAVGLRLDAMMVREIPTRSAWNEHACVAALPAQHSIGRPWRFVAFFVLQSKSKERERKHTHTQRE
jgi:hypothetical protein